MIHSLDMQINSTIEILMVLMTTFVAAGVVNYLADVLPINRRLVQPACTICNSPLNYRYYILWPRKCHSCGNRANIRHWIVQLGSLLLIMFIWNFRSSIELNFIPAFLVVMYFILVAVIDYEHRLIIHQLSLPGAILGLWAGISLHGITSTLVGGLAGFICMLILYLFGSVFISWLARHRQKTLGEEALGFGDVILGGVLGLYIGMPGIIISIMLAILSAGVVSLIYLTVMILKKEYHSNLTIPYGPFLILGAFALLFLKNNLLLIMGW